MGLRRFSTGVVMAGWQVRRWLLVGVIIIVAVWAGTRLYARHLARIAATVETVATD